MKKRSMLVRLSIPPLVLPLASLAFASSVQAQEERFIEHRTSYGDCVVVTQTDKMGVFGDMHEMNCEGRFISVKPMLWKGEVSINFYGMRTRQEQWCDTNSLSLAIQFPQHTNGRGFSCKGDGAAFLQGKDAEWFMSRARKADYVKVAHYGAYHGPIYTIPLKGFDAAYADYRKREQD